MVIEARTPEAIAGGLLYFGLLSGAGLAVGQGLLALLRFPHDPLRRLLLAPFAATVAWGLTGNLLVRFGFTMAQVTPVIAAVSLGLAAVGIASTARREFWHRMSLPPRAVAILVAVLPMVVVLVAWPWFARGLTAHLGSGNSDATYITATATAYWHYGLDATSASVAFYQRYAPELRALGPARNHSYVLLAFFSPLIEAGETVFVRNLFVCWSLFVLAASLGFYRASWSGWDRASLWQIPGYVAVTMGFGWAIVPALVGNWDNALFVSVGPALAGLAAERPFGYRYATLVGVSTAYGAYTYPELMPLLALLLVPLYLATWRERSTRRAAVAAGALAAGMAVVLLAPGARHLWDFFRHQLAAARGTGLRPGGAYFGVLVDVPFNPSGWWALGGEHLARSPVAPDALLGLLLTVLALAGALRLTRHGRHGETWAFSFALAMVAYFLFVDRYGYAIYKVLSVSWWLIGRCLFEGMAATVSWTRAARGDAWPRRAVHGLAVVALVLVLLTSLLTAEGIRHRVFFPGWIYDRQPTFAALARLRQAAKDQPPTDALVAGPSVDSFVIPWIFYTLRDTSLRPYHKPGLHPPIPGGQEWPLDRPLPDTALVTSRDHSAQVLRFKTPDFALIDLDSHPLIEHIASPNGLEPWGTWLGTSPLSISFVAGAGMRVVLSFRGVPGPSLPESPRRTIVLADGPDVIGRAEIDGPRTLEFPFVTRGRRSVLTLSTTAIPSVRFMPNGETRPLLVSIHDLKLSPAPARPRP